MQAIGLGSQLPAPWCRFNDLFIEREEDAVIKLGAVEEAASAATTPEEIAQVCVLSRKPACCQQHDV